MTNYISQGMILAYTEYKRQHPKGKITGFWKWVKKVSNSTKSKA